MSWVSKSWKKAKKWVGKHRRELAGIGTLGLSEAWRNQAVRGALITGAGTLVGGAPGAMVAGSLVSADQQRKAAEQAAEQSKEALRQEEAYNNQQIALAKQQAELQAGQQTEFTSQGSESALKKLMQKRVAGLQGAIRTSGQTLA